jgi:hypothetical protein
MKLYFKFESVRGRSGVTVASGLRETRLFYRVMYFYHAELNTPKNKTILWKKKVFVNTASLCWILGAHGSDYEEYNFLGSNTVSST